MIAVPIERVRYVQWFYFDPSGVQDRWQLLDYSEQSITDEGCLCPDKPIRVRNDKGSEKGVKWGQTVWVEPDCEPAEPKK